jgi:WD40 repeat protein
LLANGTGSFQLLTMRQRLLLLFQQFMARLRPSSEVGNYKAFISYSHAADGKLAPTVQKALQTFAKPWYRLRTFTVFRDDTDLSMTPALWAAIEKALGQSEHFLLFASRESAGSTWVEKEVDFWLRNRQLDKLFIVLTDGAVVWNSHAQDFDWAKTTALPKNVAGKFGSEPLFLNLSWWRTSDVPLSLRHTEFRSAILKMSAALLNRRVADLDSEEVRQHRRNLRAAWSAGAALSIATAIAVVASVRFVRERDEAQRQARTAWSRQIAAEARAQINERPDLALLLGLEASDIEDNLETRTALLQSLQAHPQIERMLYSFPVGTAGMAVHPKAPVVAMCTGTDAIEFRNWRTGESVGRISTSNLGLAECLAFSPDGSRLVSSHSGGRIVQWDAERRAEVSRFSTETDSIYFLQFLADGSLLVAVKDNAGLFLWDVAKQQRIKVPLLEGKEVKELACHRDPLTIATAEAGGEVVVWDVSTLQPKERIPSRGDDKTRPDALALSPDGKVLAVAYHDGLIRLCTLGAQTSDLHDFRATQPMEIEAMGLAFSSDGRRLAASYADGAIQLFDVADEQKTGSLLRAHRFAVGALVFAEEPAVLLSAGWEGKLVVWNLDSTIPLARRALHPGGMGVEQFAISEAGLPLALFLNSPGVHAVWDVQTAKQLGPELKSVDGNRVDAVTMDSAGHWLAGNTAAGVFLWNATNGELRQPSLETRSDQVTMAFSHDGALLGIIDNTGLVRIWRTTTGVELCPSFNHGTAAKIEFSPDASLLVTAGTDGMIKVWKLPDGRQTGPTWQSGDGWPVRVAISPNGRILATSSGAAEGSYVQMWELASGKPHGPRMLGHKGPVTALAFRPDGKVLASGGYASSVVLWDVENPRPSGLSLPGHSGGVDALRFSADGKQLFSGDDDGKIIVWDVDVHSWRSRAADIVQRLLTGEERLQFVGDLPQRIRPAKP